MSLPFAIYILDTETTGLDPLTNEVIEISIYRLNDNVQRTWCIKPDKYDTISPDSLRINGHKIQDLKHQTEFGKETYQVLKKVLPDIENFFMEDGEASDARILVGQNCSFDLGFIKEMWLKENTMDTFPFGNRPKMIDTMQLALFLDLVNGERSQYYNLGSLIKKYGIKNTKAHSATADTLATKELFMAQLNYTKSKLSEKVDET